jgi:SPP1 family predicted phage head-tail adaptor
VNAGAMDRRIRIEQATTSADGYGQPIETWSLLAEVWAEVAPLRGRELWAAQQVNAELTTRFRIRYRSDVTEKMRIICEGTEYDIESIAEIGRREGLEIMATAKVPA